MSADWTQVQKQLKDLSKLLPYTHGNVFEGYYLNDWRPFWEAAKELQPTFKDGIDASREDRNELWKRFNELRDEAGAGQSKERNDFRDQSEHLRNEIVGKSASLYFTAFEHFTDNLVDPSQKLAADVTCPQ